MLDIIIPTYNNKEGLRRTLNSIDTSLLDDIKITIVDDYSNLTYDDIINDFPFVNFLYNQVNIGPGMTRQYGINNTHNPYIIFIDTGDIFISKEAQQNVLFTLNKYPNRCIYSWHFLTNNIINHWTDNHLHGQVYNRKFLQDYHITFCKEGSRANEDIGFNRTCKIIIKQYNLPMMRIETPSLIEWIREENSLTKRNNCEFSYKFQNIGLALNSAHTIKICKLNHIDNQTILEEINLIMANMFYGILCAAQERPEFLQDAWDGARLFYFNVYILEPNAEDYIDITYPKIINKIMSRKKRWKHNIAINYKRFLIDIKLFEQPPASYIF